MGITRFGQVQADAFLGSQAEASPFGKIWYVDGTNGADDNLGDSPGTAKSSVAGVFAVMKASRGDTAVFYPGTYTITTALVPVAHTTFKAAHVVPAAPSVIITGDIAELITVDVDGVRFIGIEFKASGATCKELVDVADGANVRGPIFEDCVFNGNSLNNAGLVTDDPTYAATGLVVRRCLFKGVEGISNLEIGVLGAPYAVIENNTFVLDSTLSVGIAIADTAGTSGVTDKLKGQYIIRNNDVIGLYSKSSVGIKISGTEGTLPPSLIRNNYFGNCAAAAITIDKGGVNLVNNYVGDTGTGGTLVDAGN